MMKADRLEAGEVGYIITTIREPADIRIGDTITQHQRACVQPLPGFQEVHPMVFSGVYPIDSRDYEALKFSIAKLQLNDAAFVAQPENSTALGAGFRCGFLGLLHMEIVQERLAREYNMDVLLTYPSVVYHVYCTDGRVVHLDNPAHLPDPSEIARTDEPVIRAQIIAPVSYMGGILNLIMEKRGECSKTETVDQAHVMITAEIPLHEIVVDFYDKLKTLTRGFGSMDYEPAGYKEAPLVKLEMMVNGEPVDAFASIVHRDHAHDRGRQLAEKLKDAIPPHMFQVAVQAAVGGKVVARETVRAMRKNETAKCYGGDITRKRKLLEKQKEGKKKMKQFGRVNIPQEAFVAVLKTTD
jgi:GTP-binding protein LepA